MTAEEIGIDSSSEGGGIPHRHGVPHYHGSAVRALFVIGALVLIVAQSTGAELPFSTFGAVISAVILVIAAGITNPSISWIHWVNAFLSFASTIIFGTSAVAHYRAGLSAFDPSFIFTEAITLIALLALYFSTRTIRGMFLRATFL